MRLKNRLDNQPWGFDAMFDTPTTITRSFGHKGYESAFLKMMIACFHQGWVLSLIQQNMDIVKNL
jgi:hypothetical protein